MGIAQPAPSVCSSSKKTTATVTATNATITTTTTTTHHLYPIIFPIEKDDDNNNTNSENSMSHEYHPQHHHHHHQQQANIYTFPNGFDRSAGLNQQAEQATVAATAEDPAVGLHPVYETAGMLSEMFNFGHGSGPAPGPELLDYRRAVGGIGPADWYGNSREVPRDDQHHIGEQHQHHHHHQQQQQHQMGGISAHDSAAAMQLFLTNPPPRSPSPPPPPPPPQAPPAPNIQPGVGGGGFHTLATAAAGVVHPSAATTATTSNHPSFWSAPHMNNPAELSGIVEGQGLSLSLSSSLQHLEAAKQAEEEFRNIGGPSSESHIMFFNHHQGNATGVGPSSSTTTSSPGGHFFKNLAPSPHHLQPLGGFGSQTNAQHQVHLGYGSAATSSLGVVNVLRNSKYAKPAQDLLEEFCSVGRGQIKKPKLGRQNSSTQNPSTSGGGGGGGAGGAGSSSSMKDPPQLSPADRIEHQRRKVKLVAMLDEVDRRYNQYCEQMQMVVNSFDLIMGYGAAIPYTALAQKAMSRHFRCLKDAIQVQLKHSCEMLGEKDPTTSSGITKGETPRLKVLEQSLRQQRAFHQMGMMDQEAWRPQRGLPERSVNVLRAWLFEHFLHPYPSDADKHLLARQTGLSRNQVSNWFINARVRLWKPMIEEMYQQESKDMEEELEREREGNQTSSSTSNSFATQHQQQQQQQQAATTQNPMPSSSAAAAAASSATASTSVFTEGKRSADTMTPVAPPPDRDPSILAINRHQQHPPPQPSPNTAAAVSLTPSGSQEYLHGPDDTCHFGADNVGPTTMIRFGTATGDVSLTLGLRHAGNAPEKGAAAFSVRDFGNC